jgi:hypothetical protein
MKTILEISSRQEVRYEMPDEVYELIARILDHRFVKTVRRAVAMLPPELAAQVTVGRPVKREPTVRGHKASFIYEDEVLDLPREWKQEYMCQFIEPDQGWNSLGRPIFPVQPKPKGEDT